MIEEIIKKDGSKELFDLSKMKKSIENACLDSGLDSQKSLELVDKISSKVLETLEDRSEITSFELRNHILKELDLYAPEVASSWRDYESTK
ncbi:MAG: ATP cone domain-containing protein [Minisyncoccia bacterium]